MQKKAASTVAKKLSDGLILYLQAVCDLCLNSDPGTVLPGYVQDKMEGSDLMEKFRFFSMSVKAFLEKLS